MYLQYEKINKLANQLFNLIMISSFCCPRSLTYNFPIISKITTYLQLICMIYTLIIFFKYSITEKIDKCIYIFILYESTLIISTVINRGSFLDACIESFRFIILFIFLYMQFNYNSNFIFKWFRMLLCILIVINFITLLVYPDGMYELHNLTWETNNNWFLGDKNGIINYLLPAMLLSNIDLKRKNTLIKKTNFIILLLISAFTTVKINSTTSIFVFCIFLFSIVFPNIINNTKIFNIENYFIVGVLVFIMFVILNFRELLSFIVVDIFHKTLEFSNRTHIWKLTLQSITENLFCGVGYQPSDNVTAIIHQVNSHNHFLWITYRTGIVGTSFFLVLLMSMANRLRKLKFTNTYVIYSLTLFCFFIEWMFEVCTNYTFTFMFVLGFSIEKLYEKGEIN